MTTEIPNLSFDANLDNTQFQIHQCAESDRDEKCSYGVISWSIADHEYFGRRLSTWAKDEHCPNPQCPIERAQLEEQIASVRAQIQRLDTPITQQNQQSMQNTLRLQMLRLQLERLKNDLNDLPCYTSQTSQPDKRTDNGNRPLSEADDDKNQPLDGNVNIDTGIVLDTRIGLNFPRPSDQRVVAYFRSWGKVQLAASQVRGTLRNI